MRMIAGAAALLLGLLAAGCNGEVVGGGERPAQVLVVSGDLQTGTAGQELPQPLVVKVVDDAGRLLRNQLVNFRVTRGGGSVFAGSAITNRDGVAQERWTLGTVAGDTQQVEARAVNATTGEPITFAAFRAVGRAGAPAAMTAEAPSTRPGALGATLGAPLVARLTDAHGNGIPGAAVTWTVAGGGSLAGAEATTDAQGRARATWTLGTTAGAAQTVDASVQGLAAARFTAAPAIGTATVHLVSGGGQSGLVGQALAQPVVVEVRGAGGKPLAGVAMSATHPAGSTIAAAHPVTDAQGRMSFTWTLPTTPGQVQAGFSALGGDPASQGVSVAATAVAGPASSLQTQLGFPAQTGPYALAGREHQVTVTVKDAYGNPMPNVQVTGTVQAGGGSVDGPATTGANGIAVLSWTMGTTEGSPQRLQVSAGGQTATVERTARYVWVTPQSPAPGTVVTTSTLRARAGGSHYLGGFSCTELTACITITYAGRTAQMYRLPTELTWVADLDLAGLPAGPVDLVFRIEHEGHADEETVQIIYQP